MVAGATTETILTIAEDVGRLRRGLTPGSSLWHLADRLAGSIYSLYWANVPTAGELVRYERLDVQDALATVDQQHARLLRLLRDDLREDWRTIELAERRLLEAA